MCGIAGLVGTRDRDRTAEATTAASHIIHRGPDSFGLRVDERSALVVRRLKVIDLETGDQPQANETGMIWTVFNGEIYNFRELRKELGASGHTLRTASDTEVIVHLYEDLGERFVERLEGMFAIALWDAQERRLVLARDRLGKKPLLYAQSDGELVFASEHRALLAALPRRPRTDPDAIHVYLRLGYVPAPLDAFEGVRKLPPAHTLTWEDGRVTLRRYWSLPSFGTLRIGEREAAAELRRLFERSVARRLIADVPLGAFLSGGSDSAATVATMSRLSATVRTFTIGFDDPDLSETIGARRVAERYGTDHHEYTVRPVDLDLIPELVRHYGEPFADSSAVPTWVLSRLTRQSVTVALDGTGGDELFAGYDRYYAMRLASTIDEIPQPIRMPVLAGLARSLPPKPSARTATGRARRFVRAAQMHPKERYLSLVGIFDHAAVRQLVEPSFLATTRDAMASVDLPQIADPVAAAQRMDMERYLPDDLLVKTDIASMASSLEVRCPFLDRELVEFAVSLPTDLKLRGRTRKHLVKVAFADDVPEENLHGRKRGFGAPVNAWFRGDLAALMRETVLSPRALARGIVRTDAIRRLVDEHASGRADHSHGLWALLMLELWHREFIDG